MAHGGAEAGLPVAPVPVQVRQRLRRGPDGVAHEVQVPRLLQLLAGAADIVDSGAGVRAAPLQFKFEIEFLLLFAIDREALSRVCLDEQNIRNMLVLSLNAYHWKLSRHSDENADE